MGDIALEVERLTKTYRGEKSPALNGIGFAVNSGEIYGLLGPNGAGKTTVISIICSLIPMSSGTVEVLGMDVRRDRRGIKKLIGVVPQDVALYSNLSIRENLMYFGRQYGLGGDRLKRSVEDCIKTAGLEEHADRRVNKLSGGLKRRANLVTGIIHQPKLLLLDEPTVGIDAQSRNRIFDMLDILRKDGVTMLYTTHYMEEAERLCSRVAIIDGGAVIAEDTPGTLIHRNGGCENLEQVFLHLTGKQLRD
jgi:ABC-2 type transport system ATP-binding protein